MVYLTRRVCFNAAHKLYCDHWTEEENKAAFGKCANANWHGHNYQLFVTIKGKPDPNTGFVMNAKELAVIIKEHITEKLDHKNLNLDVDFLKGIQPSSENLVVAIWQQLAPFIEKKAKLHAIKLYETENIFVEYFGEA